MVTLRCRQSTESSRWRHGGDGPEKERSRKGQRSHEPGGNEAFAGESAPLLGVLTPVVDVHEHSLCCQGHRTQHAGRPSTTAYSIQQAI